MLPAALLACALHVAPTTMDTLVGIESSGRALAIHVNKLTGEQPHPTTVQEAVAISRSYVAKGYTVDMSYTQLNSANLVQLGYSFDDAFDPCKNLAAGGIILHRFYGAAVSRFGEGQTALAAALSAYHSGNFQFGFTDGYVAKYYVVPPIDLPHSMVTLVAINKHAADTEVW